MSSLPRRDGDDHRQQQQHAPAPALDLLDEYWFFSNTLVRNDSADKPGRKPPSLPRSPSTSAAAADDGTMSNNDKEGSGARRTSSRSRLGCRRLLRTPSLPSPRVGISSLPSDYKEEEEEQEEAVAAAAAAGGGGNDDQHRQVEVEVGVDDDDLNWSSIYEGVLRTRMAEGPSSRSPALQRAPSMPVPSSAMTDHHDGRHQSTPSMPRLRHSYSTLGRHTPAAAAEAADQQTPRTPAGMSSARREVRSSKKSARSEFHFQDKKCKSSSDLESIEVQGFKDLGFVFDREELRESLADVLPGLRGDKGGSARRRPYLSEAWQRPALMRVQPPDARSAAEMKDQLRMWAQAVACNVRQEC